MFHGAGIYPHIWFRPFTFPYLPPPARLWLSIEVLASVWRFWVLRNMVDWDRLTSWESRGKSQGKGMGAFQRNGQNRSLEEQRGLILDQVKRQMHRHAWADGRMDGYYTATYTLHARGKAQHTERKGRTAVYGHTF